MYGINPDKDYRHMYDIKDLRGHLPKNKIYKDTILHTITEDHRCHDMTRLIKLFPDISGKLNSEQSKLTIFIPLCNIDIDIDDVLKSREFISYHILDNAVSNKFIQSSRMMKLYTRDGDHITVENTHGRTLLNGYSNILGYRIVSSSMIFYIDTPLYK
jgi:hypothetical protein